MDEFYNKHYIRTDANGNITRGFSDAFEQPKHGDICINARGGYQFRLYPGGEENPYLMNEYGVYLYRYTDGNVTAKLPDELDAERPYFRHHYQSGLRNRQ